MMKTLSSLLVLASLAAAAPAVAEEVSAAQQKAISETQSSDGDLRIGHAAPGFLLSADGDGEQVSIIATRSWQRGLPANSLSFKISAPFDKDRGEGNFLTDGGSLNAGTTLGLAFTQIAPIAGPIPGNAAYRTEVLELARRACAQSAPETDRARCATLTYSEAEPYVPAEAARILADEAFLNAPVWMWGFSAAVGEKQFSYRDPVTFAGSSRDRTPYSLSLTGGVRLKRDRVYVGGALEHKEEFAAASSRTLCRALSTPGLQECVSGPFAGPRRQTTSDAFGVVRWRGGERAPYAVELKAGYDFEQEVFAMTTSLYMVFDSHKDLRGGVRLGWRSDDDDPTTHDQNFTIGAFVGVPFSVF